MRTWGWGFLTLCCTSKAPEMSPSVRGSLWQAPLVLEFNNLYFFEFKIKRKKAKPH